MLYIRMILIMMISLYTSRIALEALGITDFGILNLVGGDSDVIIFFECFYGFYYSAFSYL